MSTLPSEAGQHPIHESLLTSLTSLTAEPHVAQKLDESERDEDDRWAALPCTD